MIPEFSQHIESIEKGDLLISEPFLNDPNFERTVVLVCESNENGHVGLVLNKAMEEVTLEDVLEDAIDLRNNLYIGGPVEPSLLQFVHTVGPSLDNSVQISDVMYWGGDFEQAKLLLSVDNIKRGAIRFFLGYSGWGPDQLKKECDEDAWIVIKDYQNDLLKIDPKEMWREILKEKGDAYKMLSNFPIDPRLN